MVSLANMGTNTLTVKLLDGFNTRLAVNRKGHQPFAKRILNAANNRDITHFTKTFEIINAIQHGIGQRFFVNLDGPACCFQLGAWIIFIRELFTQPFEIVHN